MSLLKQIEDKGAVVSWCPIDEHRGLVALGTKDSSGIGFDDHGGELEVHSLDFSVAGDLSTYIIGKARASSRFSSIAWSQMASHSASFPMGLIAGGMADGTINVWNPAKLSSGDEEGLLASLEQHTGAIPGLHFNPHKESSHLLASGGSDGEVYVTSLENPHAPSVFVPAPPPTNAKHTADVTQVAWNSQVVHILASAAQNGGCYVWDLRQKRAWCELKDPSGGAVSDIAWNPEQGLHIVTASGDDRNPVIKLWDLRSSTSLPLATLQGHTEGVLSVSWCPSDTSLLLSCGKDNRTILWDLFNLQAVYELPVREPTQNRFPSEQSVFGSLASSASHRRYHVAWSPCLPAVVSAASFDRKVQFFSMTGARSKVGRAPKWARRPIAATFGFGGKLVKINNHAVSSAAASASSAQGGGKKQSGGGQLQIFQVEENPELVASSDFFHSLVSKGQYKEFCEHKSNQATDPDARKVWSLMNVICFGTNAREELLTYLGFDSATIIEAAKKYLASRNPAAPVLQSSASAEDLFSSPTVPADSPKGADLTDVPHLKGKVNEMLDLVMSWEEAEPTIRRAVVVGNFEMAVDCCLAAGLLAEALLLAQCGDHELRARTQAAFFERQRNKHPFLNVLHAVIKNQLMDFVLSSDLNNWRETLALLSTYGKSEEFSSLCEALANRLETEQNDKSSAALCFMCAANVHRTIKFWTEQLQEANQRLGQLDTNALQDYVEKIMVFTHANPTDNLGAECGTFFARYGELLVNQGRLTEAAAYLKGSSTAESVLMDRIYHAGNKPAGSRPPPFPFTKILVEPPKAGGGSPVPATQSTVLGGASSAQQNDHRAAAAFNTRQRSGEGAASHGASGATTATNPAAASAAAAAAAAAGVSSVAAAPAAAPAHTSHLPPGWIQLHDPKSNMYYYVNQATGQSQWDPPVAVAPALPMPAPAPAMVPAATMAPMAPGPAMPSSVPMPMPMAVPSSSTAVAPDFNQASAAPKVIEIVRPGGPSHAAAAAPGAGGPSLAAGSAPASALGTGPVEADCVVALGQMIEAIAACALNPQEKKQLAMVRQSYTALFDKLKSGALSETIIQKLSLFMDNIVAKNFVGATAVQTDLVSSAWNEHKDWIKGIKLLIELAKRK